MTPTPPDPEPLTESLRSWRLVVEETVIGELDRLAAIDHDLSAELAKLSVTVELEAPENDPDLLGQYIGVPMTEYGSDSIQLPPLIQLFLFPLVDYCTPEDLDRLEPDLQLLRQEVLITVRHEIAHHLGLEHDRLETLGLL